jgi:hypothetical protein
MSSDQGERSGEDRDGLRPEERAALDAWAVPDPPDGFADRVMTAMARAPATPDERPARARSWRWLAIALAAVGAVTVWQLGIGRRARSPSS